MNRIRFFTRPDCAVCRAALYVIRRVRTDIAFELETVDISAPGNEEWSDAYHDAIPVTHLNGKEIFRGGIDERRLRRLLQTFPQTDV